MASVVVKTHPPLPPPGSITSYFRATVTDEKAIDNSTYKAIGTPISLLLNTHLTNKQKDSALIANVSVEVSGSWPWSRWTRLCLVSLLPEAGQLAFMGSGAVRFFADDFALEHQLKKPIDPHATISGWTAWVCPNTGCDLTNIKFVISDAAGNASKIILAPPEELVLSSLPPAIFKFAPPPVVGDIVIEPRNSCRT
jgi:hypothetical protein